MLRLYGVGDDSPYARHTEGLRLRAATILHDGKDYTMIVTDEALSTALDEIHICDPDAAALCEDVLEQLERRKDQAAVDEWIAMIVKASAGPRATAAIKAQARTKLEQPAQPAARPQRSTREREPVRERERALAPVSARRTITRALGVAAIAFGLLLWIPGSRYALDGWIMGINVVLDVAYLDVRVPIPKGWWSLLLLPLGIVYSIAERKVVPVQFIKVNGKRQIVFLGWIALIAWALVHGTDLGATWLGATDPRPNSWPITVWMARTVWASIGWSVVLTYIPEALFAKGWRWIGLPWPLWSWD